MCLPWPDEIKWWEFSCLPFHPISSPWKLLHSLLVLKDLPNCTLSVWSDATSGDAYQHCWTISGIKWKMWLREILGHFLSLSSVIRFGHILIDNFRLFCYLCILFAGRDGLFLRSAWRSLLSDSAECSQFFSLARLEACLARSMSERWSWKLLHCQGPQGFCTTISMWWWKARVSMGWHVQFLVEFMEWQKNCQNCLAKARIWEPILPYNQGSTSCVFFKSFLMCCQQYCPLMRKKKGKLAASFLLYLLALLGRSIVLWIFGTFTSFVIISVLYSSCYPCWCS